MTLHRAPSAWRPAPACAGKGSRVGFPVGPCATAAQQIAPTVCRPAWMLGERRVRIPPPRPVKTTAYVRDRAGRCPLRNPSIPTSFSRLAPAEQRPLRPALPEPLPSARSRELRLHGRPSWKSIRRAIGSRWILESCCPILAGRRKDSRCCATPSAWPLALILLELPVDRYANLFPCRSAAVIGQIGNSAVSNLPETRI